MQVLSLCVNMLTGGKLPKSKPTQTWGACPLVTTSAKSITTMLVDFEAGCGGNASSCKSCESKGHFKS